MEQILNQHDKMIDEHDDKLDKIQQDLTDIRVRLGIKDLSNGQVVEYQKQLADAIVLEREERKESDRILREDIKNIDSKTWWILGSVIFEIILGIGLALVGGLI